MALSIVGKRAIRLEAPEKVTGSAAFVADLKLPGLLVGKVLRSPHPHARILNIDTSRARALAGVKTVVTFTDTPGIKYNAAAHPAPGSVLLRDQYLLADTARYVGDPVAAVAAVDEDTAAEALDLIRVDYQPLPFVLEAEAAMAPGAPLLHDSGRNIVGRVEFTLGDVEDGFREADHIFEHRYRTSKVFPCSVEPPGVTMARADWSGRLTVWSSTQMPHQIRRIVAGALGVPQGKVRVIKPYVGGGFGSRLGAVNEPLCALLAMRTQKPVRLAYSIEETFLGTESRHPIDLTLRTGVKADGTLTARRLDAILNAGAYATHSVSFASPVGNWFRGMYKCPNYRYEGIAVYTNTSPSGAFRGYGNPQVNFAVESQMDEIAEHLGLDPLTLREKNHPCMGDIWERTKWPIESCGLEEALSLGAAEIGWREKRGKSRDGGKGRAGGGSSSGTGDASSTGNAVRGGDAFRHRGVGMAYMLHCSCGRPALHELSTAMVKMNEDGSANLLYAGADSGQGSLTVMAQIVAETVGIPLEQVQIDPVTDTDLTGFEVGSHASRQIYAGGNAVRRAALAARHEIVALAADIVGAAPGDLEIADGVIRSTSDEQKQVTVAEICREALFGSRRRQIIGMVSEEPEGNPPVYAAQFAEVEVDTRTGAVEVLKLVAAHDVGVAINPANVEGQIEGALQQGLGYALTEEVVHQPATGRPGASNLGEYKVLTAKDMPEIKVIIVEAASRTGPYGAKGVGESGLVPTAAAIGNAIYDAVGVHLDSLPFTPSRVLAALKGEAGAKGAVITVKK
ncbi:MAG: molybdopterin-dependent oxidoreductase [Firmicutes bacterium]|nr:molybdopterin-dependent oxidoreductase [Bacillota bacterium]